MNPSNFKTNNHISSNGNSNKNLATKFMEKLNEQSTRNPRVGFKAIKGKNIIIFQNNYQMTKVSKDQKEVQVD